jgi:integrase
MACITKRRGRWVIDFYDQHGKRRWKTLPKGTTKKKARDELRQIEEQVERGTFLPLKKIPNFSEVATQWLGHKKINIRDHTYSAYECHIRRNLKPFFGNLKITNVNYNSISKFTAQENVRGASIYHVKKSLVILGGIMGYAVRQRLIDWNPVREAEKPRGRSCYRSSDEMNILRPDEIRQFLDHVEGLKYRTFFTLAVMTGARQGELIGLMWSDIDWYNSQVLIRRTFQRGRLYEPKSKTSRRKIDIGPTVIGQLKKWKLACPPTELDLVFPSDAGTPLDKHNLVRRHFEPALRRAGLRKIRFHDLRHTFASLLIAQGEHPKYIQSQMGHSSISVTMDVYGHLMDTVNQDAAKRLDSAIFEENGSKMVAMKKEGKSSGR